MSHFTVKKLFREFPMGNKIMWYIGKKTQYQNLREFDHFTNDKVPDDNVLLFSKVW